MSTPGLDMGVVVLSFGRSNRHAELVRALTREQGVAEDAVIVVHNGYDRSDRWLPEQIGDVATLATGDNLGYAGGMNVGIRHHVERGRRWVLCLTHEVQLGPDCVRRLVEAAASGERLGVLGPQLASHLHGPPWSQGVVAVRGGVRHRVGVSELGAIAPCESVDGSVLFMRSAAFQEAGPLDERMFMYWEETEFCQRVRRHGWTVAVVPNATAVSSMGLSDRTAAHAYLMARNGMLYARNTRRRWAVSAHAGRTLFEIWRDIPKPGGRRFRHPAMWRLAAVRTRASLWGLLDYRRGRWGQPPARLTRGSDIRAPDPVAAPGHLSNPGTGGSPPAG